MSRGDRVGQAASPARGGWESGHTCFLHLSDPSEGPGEGGGSGVPRHRPNPRTSRPSGANGSQEVAFGEGEEGMMDLWKWTCAHGRDGSEDPPLSPVPSVSPPSRADVAASAESASAMGLRVTPQQALLRAKPGESPGSTEPNGSQRMGSRIPGPTSRGPLCLPHLRRAAARSVCCTSLLVGIYKYASVG